MDPTGPGQRPSPPGRAGRPPWADGGGDEAELRRALRIAQAREERRRRAESEAAQLLAEARASASDSVVAQALHLLCRTLGADRATLALGPEGRPRAWFAATAREPAPAGPLGGPGGPEPGPADGNAAVTRLHAMLYRAGSPGPCGRLSVHSNRPRSFRAAEVALVDAVAGLLAGEAEVSGADLGRPGADSHAGRGKGR